MSDVVWLCVCVCACVFECTRLPLILPSKNTLHALPYTHTHMQVHDVSECCLDFWSQNLGFLHCLSSKERNQQRPQCLSECNVEETPYGLQTFLCRVETWTEKKMKRWISKLEFGWEMVGKSRKPRISQKIGPGSKARWNSNARHFL